MKAFVPERAIDAFGTVHFLFNSAGAAIRRAKFLEIDDALIEKTFDLNLKGTLDYFIENTFNYPTLAEAYKIAALDAWNRMQPPD